MEGCVAKITERLLKERVIQVNRDLKVLGVPVGLRVERHPVRGYSVEYVFRAGGHGGAGINGATAAEASAFIDGFLNACKLQQPAAAQVDFQMIEERGGRDMFRSVKELQAEFAAAQERAGGHDEELTNGDVVKILEVDILIRKAAGTAGHAGWDTPYCRSNIGPLGGANVIEKTEALVAILRERGLDKLYDFQDFPLRNAKHIFDDIPEELIAPLLPQINEIMAAAPGVVSNRFNDLLAGRAEFAEMMSPEERRVAYEVIQERISVGPTLTPEQQIYFDSAMRKIKLLLDV
jgi:hypothetical protein